MSAISLTGPEFLAAWNTLGLGDTPVELQLRPTGHTIAERDRAFADSLGGLRERALADALGPGPRLTAALRLLAHAPLVFDLRLSNGLLALGAVQREHGVVLDRKAEGTLRLVEVSGPQVPAALVELIGPLRAGRSRTVNLDADLLDRARAQAGDGSPWTLADTLVELGTPRADANSLARMCTGVTAWGQIGALARAAGTEHRGRWVVGFHRSSAGDFLQLRRPSSTGHSHVTIAPTTAEALQAQIRELAAAHTALRPSHSSPAPTQLVDQLCQRAGAV